jgi:hypothetical protein
LASGTDKKSSDDNSFTLVTYKKKAHVPTRDSTPTARVGVLYSQEVSLLQFKQFQARIYPILTRLITSGDYQDTFSTKWKQAQQGTNPITANSTFCTVSKALALKDLKDYMQRISAVKGIHKYVTLSDSKVNEDGFKADFLPEPEDVNSLTPIQTIQPPDTENTDADSTVIKDTDSITTVHNQGKICYGNDTDLHELFADIWPYITNFINQQPNHDHSIQWTTWLKNGLTPSSGLHDVKRIMGIDALSQLYLIFTSN